MSEVQIIPVGDGLNVIFNGQPLYSTYNPLRGAQRGLPAPQEATLYIIASPLLGYGVASFLQTLPKTSYILCVEKDSALDSITREHLSTWQHSQSCYLFCPSDEELITLIKKIQPLGIQHITSFLVNQGGKIHADYYDTIIKTCQNVLSIELANQATLAHNADIWLDHLFKNLAFLPHTHVCSISASTDAYVVIGAGPSLEMIIEDLKKYRTHFRLIAVDTALPCLNAAGIEAEFIFALESSHHNMQDFILEKQEKIALYCDVTSYPQHARLPNVESYFFLTRFAQITLLQRLQGATQLPIFPPLGSVGLTAMAFALQATSGPIFYAGLDFSFKLGQNHARGAYSHTSMLSSWTRLTPYKSLLDQLNGPLIRHVNSTGEAIYTHPLLVRYAQMAAQGDLERIFCLCDLGLPLGYHKGQLSALPKLKPASTVIKKHPFSRIKDMQFFCQKEASLLENFLDNPTQIPQELDYIMLGIADLNNIATIKERAQKFYEKWRELYVLYQQVLE